MPCTINNNTSHDLSQLEDLTKKLVPFAQKQIGFNRPPTINFNDDENNAANPLGRTAQYDPSNMEIIIFVTGRHTKDILRSIAHELVHHGQNCRGDLDGDIQTELGYAQNNKHMRGMEREAYEVGNLCFRDWEDGIKQQLPLHETIYRESLIGGESMTLKNWRIKELNDLMMEKWGYKPPVKKKLDEELDAYMDMLDYQTGEESLDEDDDDDDGDGDGDGDDDDESSSHLHLNPQSPTFRLKIKSGRKRLQEVVPPRKPPRKPPQRRRTAADIQIKKAAAVGHHRTFWTTFTWAPRTSPASWTPRQVHKAYKQLHLTKGKLKPGSWPGEARVRVALENMYNTGKFTLPPAPMLPIRRWEKEGRVKKDKDKRTKEQQKKDHDKLKELERDFWEEGPEVIQKGRWRRWCGGHKGVCTLLWVAGIATATTFLAKSFDVDLLQHYRNWQKGSATPRAAEWETKVGTIEGSPGEQIPAAPVTAPVKQATAEKWKTIKKDGTPCPTGTWTQLTAHGDPVECGVSLNGQINPDTKRKTAKCKWVNGCPEFNPTIE